MAFKVETCEYMKNVTSYDETLENIRKAFLAPPQIVMRLQCYHYEKRNNNKNTERVVTRDASKDVQFTDWVDKSPPIEAIDHIDVFKVCRLYTHKNFLYSTEVWESYMK